MLNFASCQSCGKCNDFVYGFELVCSSREESEVGDAPEDLNHVELCPPLELGSVFELAVVTSSKPLADTDGEVYVSFLVDGSWSAREHLFTGVRLQAQLLI